MTLACTVAIAPAIAPAAVTFRVSSRADSGAGTLREAIESANVAPGSTIEIALGTNDQILVKSALPALTARGTRLDGGGATLREGPGCRRPGGLRGCDGIVVTASEVLVSNLRVVGFTFDGVSVLGRDTADVRIERVEAIDNLDDGVGVSDGAGPVSVEHCLLMGNGFRTKGKGLLVFDDSTAVLRDSVVVANRDGVTVTRGSSATLERVLVASNYDKGVGVSAATLTGEEVQVLGNGYDADANAASPNGDGLRVGLGASAQLTASRIAGSGDGGVVVLDNSTVSLRDCVVEGNRGVQTSVSPGGRLSRDGRDVRVTP